MNADCLNVFKNNLLNEDTGKISLNDLTKENDTINKKTTEANGSKRDNYEATNNRNKIKRSNTQLNTDCNQKHKNINIHLIKNYDSLLHSKRQKVLK